MEQFSKKKKDSVKKNLKRSCVWVLSATLVLSGLSVTSNAKVSRKPKKIILNAKKKKLTVGSKFKLRVKKVKPSKAIKKVRWKSNNGQVASVSKSGVVKAKKVGVAKITAISKKNKRIKAICTITVVSDNSSNLPDDGGVQIVPSAAPSSNPTVTPTSESSALPSISPSSEPTKEPIVEPTLKPTDEPAAEPTAEPSSKPSADPTDEPVVEPTLEPTGEPVIEPTVEPTAEPSSEPSANPTDEPVVEPTLEPTDEPVIEPTVEPTAEPSSEPSANPTDAPIVEPTLEPTDEPVVEPTVEPTNEPSVPTSTPELANSYKVTFLNYDGNILKTENVMEGESAEAPSVPKRIGYIFTDWDKDFDNITEDLVVTAQYEKDTSSSIIVSDVVVKPGDTDVEVAVYVNNNPGILGMTLTISYDDNVMTLKDAATGEAIENILTFTKANILKNNCNFTWDGQELSEADIKDGTILILTFDISDTASAGEYKIGFSYDEGDIVDTDLSSLNLEIVEGIVTIQ